MLCLSGAGRCRVSPESQCCSGALISGNFPQVPRSEENPAFFFIRDKVTADKAFDVGRQERADDALPHFEAPCCSATLENSFHVLIARHMMSPSMKGEARPGIQKKKKKRTKRSHFCTPGCVPPVTICYVMLHPAPRSRLPRATSLQQGA